MRVIAGSAKGRRIEAPKGRDIRPTSDRVREALFSILGPRIADARFLDLFAGTGANGIEALSRGAASCVFADNAPEALALIRRNLSHTGFAAQAECIKLELPRDLPQFAARTSPFDLVFADPPYTFSTYEALTQALDDKRLAAPEALLIIEHERRATLPESTGRWTRYRKADYGDTALSFYT